MKCPKCQHENRDGAKFCEECGEKLQPVCPKCGSELRPNAKFCDECGAKVTESDEAQAIPKLEDMHTQLQSLIPDALAQKYLSAEQQATGENRPITALFADISGFTPLSSTKSSETIFQMVQDCFKQLVSIVAKYEGSISGFRGDGLLALFGAPILHENDAERAILSAIDMREAMEDHQLQVSIGINTAMMTVGEIQTQLHNEYTAYGTDINLAKRLQESADPDQILVGSGTYRLTRRMFEFDTIESLGVKGFQESVTAYIVQQVRERPEKLRGIEGLRARMIGRVHEFADAKESVDEWLNGHGQIVSIIGEAGIGKSRLVSELKEYLNQAPSILEGRCVSIGQPISYWPFLDILRTYFGLGEEDDERARANKVTESITQLMPQAANETLPLLGNLLSIKYGNELDDMLKFASPEQIRHQTLMRLRDIFRTLAEQQPLLLILEDLHWADDLSLDLISLLMDELASTPLMLLCVYRPEHEHRVWQMGNQARRKCMDRYTEITLKPLSSGESRELIESILEIDNLPETIKSMVMDRSEGNPFFIEEVIRSLIEQGMIYQENERWIAKDEIVNIDVPDTIQSVILSRVDRLQSEAKYVLQCASVIGRLFKHRLLDHLTQHERELNRYISEFEERDLVYQERMIPELEYAFKHAFTQEATYQGILEQKRREFHHQVAQGIERLYHERLEEYYEELADHYSKSDDAEKAVEYFLKSGKKARRNYLNDTAIRYFQTAINMIEKYGMKKDEWKLDLFHEIAKVYGVIGRSAESVASYEKAIALAKDMDISPHRLARLYFGINDALYWQGPSKYDKIIYYGERGLEALRDREECFEHTLIYHNLHSAYSGKGDRQKWLKYGHKIMKILNDFPYAEESHYVYVGIIWVCCQGDKNPEIAWEWSKELEARAEKHHDLRGLGVVWIFQGDMAFSEGDYDKAIKLYEKALEMNNKIGDNKHICLSYCGAISVDHGGLLCTLLNFGRIDEIEPHVLPSIKSTEKVEWPYRVWEIHYILGCFYASQRNWNKAIHYHEKSLQTWPQNEGTYYRNITNFMIARIHKNMGNIQQSLVSLKDIAINSAKSGQYWFLANALNEIDEIYADSNSSEDFIDFCKSIKSRIENENINSAFNQWHLELAETSNIFTNQAFADDFVSPELESSWIWVDHFVDCSFKINGINGIEIHAVNGRGLGWLNVGAPRLMREISGDFAVETIIEPVSEDMPQIGGLLIWRDRDNFIRFEKGSEGKNEMRLHGHINGEFQLAGRGLLPPSDNDETYLRLERSGDEFTSYCSIDGENWFTCGKIAFPMEDPIQVGIHAIGMIDRTIYCGEYKEGTGTLFRNFRIWTK